MTTTLLRPTPAKDQRFPFVRPFLMQSFATATMALLLCCVAAEVRAEPEEGIYPALLLAPSFERPPVFRFLPGSKRTILMPARIDRNGTVLPPASWGDLNPSAWDSLLRDSQERASLILATLNPALVRDPHGVVQMAVISTDNPLTASCLLLPGFLRRFSAIFGPELIVAVPSRTKIYIFPKLANRLPEMTGTIRDDYLISPQPVSLELFELSKNGIRAIGSIDPDDQ